MPRNNQQDTASWDAREVRRVEEQHPRKKRRRRVRLIPYLLFVLAISAILAGSGWLVVSEFCSFNRAPVEAEVEITAEDDLSSIAKKLKADGLIDYPWLFKLVGRLSHAESKIGIGTYTLNQDMDYLALISAMHNASGNLNADVVKVTIPEGYTVQQILALLASKGVNTEEALTEAAKTASFTYDFIKDTGELSRLEGYLPDTYEFYLNEKPASAIKRLLDNFNRKMTEERMQAVEESGYSLKEIITIASLIEKETDGTDHAKIASVIYNRLNDSGSHGTYKMLNIDAALLYALPDHEGALTNADKKVDTPYNLYTHAGLPPTPIANPGIASIDAALHPETTDYYYYALGKDGKHHFSNTLSEHNAFLASGDYGG